MKQLKDIGWIYSNSVSEEFKAEVPLETKKFPADIGEEHPFDFEKVERWYKDDSFVTGVINKFVDFVVGPGFYIKSKDDRVKDVCEMWMKDHQFSSLLSEFVKNGLIYGNAFMELSGSVNKTPDEIKVLDSKYMYVKWDNKGRVLGYSEWLGFNAKYRRAPIVFEPYEIAHFAYNPLGSSAYGYGVIFPLLFCLEKKSKLLNDLSMLMTRKANAPIVINAGKLGNTADEDIVPDAATLQSIGQKFEWMHNKHEWIFNPYIQMKVLDFGNFGDKFEKPLDLLNKELVWGSQVPEVLLGSGNVAEGLAVEQLKAFMFRVRAIQEEVEKVLEEQIFKRLVIANGLNPEDVEFEWGEPTPEERRLNITTITSILPMYMSGGIDDWMKKLLQDRLAELLEFDSVMIDKAKKEAEEEKKQADAERQAMFDQAQAPAENPNPMEKPEMNKPLPKVPPTKLERPVIKQGENVNENFDFNKDVMIKEWVGFNYNDFLTDIKNFINSPDFETREFTSFRYIPGTEHTKWVDLAVKYKLADTLTAKQISKLKFVLTDGFEKGESMAKIARNIYNDVKPKTLVVTVPELKNKEGEVIRASFERTLSPRVRSNLIARTETIRASNEGALKNYSDNGITDVEWISAPSEACDYCGERNGDVLSLDEAHEQIPVHNNCRCSWGPVVKG